MDFSDLDTEQKIAFCQQRLGSWSSLLGGQVVTKTDDDQVELRTRIGERATRIVVDYDTGWTDVQTKVTNTTGVLVLWWDPDKQPHDSAHDPEWDSGSEQRLFLAPGLYIEEYPDEAKAMWELVGRLPQPLIQEIVRLYSGVQIKAADRLGINRNTLHKKVEQYKLDDAGIDPESNDIPTA